MPNQKKVKKKKKRANPGSMDDDARKRIRDRQKKMDKMLKELDG